MYYLIINLLKIIFETDEEENTDTDSAATIRHQSTENASPTFLKSNNSFLSIFFSFFF